MKCKNSQEPQLKQKESIRNRKKDLVEQYFKKIGKLPIPIMFFNYEKVN